MNFPTPFIWHIEHIQNKTIEHSMKYLLKNLKFPSHNQYKYKSTSFKNFHTVILKMWRRVDTKIQNSMITVITVMK